MPDVTCQVESWQQQFNTELASRLEAGDQAPAELIEAMRYSALAGGKRMRPLMVYASGQALGLDCSELHAVACAIELIHSYSLIHDDLPAMDDDDFRRGRPSCHKAFDEATAILAGDALQALAFEILAADPVLQANPGAQVQVIASIAAACGAAGMAGGQVLDLAAIDREISYPELETMHRLKTGALIRVAATTPARIASASPELCDRLWRYGDCVGLAFQVHDDILDVTGNSLLTGKPAQADAARNKPAFPSVLGVEASREKAAELCRAAISELQGFPRDTAILEWLAGYAINRDN